MTSSKHIFSLLISLVILVNVLMSCQEKEQKEAADFKYELPDVSRIPDSTVLISNADLVLENGIYYLKETAFSGFIKETFPDGETKSLGSYLDGKLHGVSKTFYQDGSLRDARTYKDNVAYGRHFGNWENGKMKFDFFYVLDKREGLQKQWYESGQAYCELTFKDDREDGMQKAWRENGKPYINYEVKDGHRYGLQKSNLCYTLKKGEIKSAEYTIVEK